MIRNYQRSGGGSVNLAPVYSSLNALQNEINSLITVTKLTSLTSIGTAITGINELSSSVTELSTAFTSHTSLYDYRWRTYTSAVGESINTLYTSLTSHTRYFNWMRTTYEDAVASSFAELSSAVAKTLTNPTMNSYVYTDPVLYSGLNAGKFEDLLDPNNNTYMKGVTWKDSPSTTITGTIQATAAAILRDCLVYGDLAYINVDSVQMQSVTASNVILSNCLDVILGQESFNSINMISVTSIIMNFGSYSSMRVNKCGTLSAWSIFCTSIQIPMCSYVYLNECMIDSATINYPINSITNYANFMNDMDYCSFIYISYDGWGRFSGCSIGKIDWYDLRGSVPVVSQCTVGELGYTGTYTGTNIDPGSFRNNRIGYLHMNYPSGSISLFNNSISSAEINMGGCYVYNNNSYGYIKHLDVTASRVSIADNINASNINVFAKQYFSCVNNSLPMMNVKMYITDYSNTDFTDLLVVENCSIDSANIDAIQDITSTTNGDMFRIKSCTFNTLSLDINSVSLASNVVSGFADIKVDNATLISNTCNGVMDGVFKTLNMTANSLTVGDFYYTRSVGSGNNIVMFDGCRTITNPTMNSYVFTNPVLYSGPNIATGNNNTTPSANTYMKGVTWMNAPATTVQSSNVTIPAALNNCHVYGDLSFSNVTSVILSNVTASNAIINSCYNYTLVGGKYNEISVNRGLGHISSISAFSFISPDCVWCMFEHCNLNEISVYYPPWVSSYINEFRLYLNSNTINKINASVLKLDATANNIWTANLYLDYDLMQTSSSRSIPGYFFSNTIHELSIFNRDHGKQITTKNAISKNRIYLQGNSIDSYWHDLLCPISVYTNTIDNIEHTLGISLYAAGNSVLEWSCKVSPYSAQIYTDTDSKQLALLSSNTIHSLDIFHDFTDESLFSDSTSPAVTAGLNNLYIDVSANTVDYATFDALNPLNISINGNVISAYVNVANNVTLACTDSVGTLNMVKNERFVTDNRFIEVSAFNAHSLGLTNVLPKFVTINSIDSLNMFIDDNNLPSTYTLSNIKANVANINIMCPLLAGDNPMRISRCTFNNFSYTQDSAQRLAFDANTINYATINGGSCVASSNRVGNLCVNIVGIYWYRNTFNALAGTIAGGDLNNNSMRLGAFYYMNTNGQGNTIDRFATGF